MSMPSGQVRCHGCNFEGVLQRRPVTLEYELPDGTRVRGYRRFAWCSVCEKITDAEENLDAGALSAQIEAIQKRQGGFFKRMFGTGDDAEAEIPHLQGQLRLAKLRRSAPRCLKCGNTSVVALDFDAKGTSNVIHSCGRRLFLVPQDPDAPRFMFKPEVIRLDVEGNRV